MVVADKFADVTLAEFRASTKHDRRKNISSARLLKSFLNPCSASNSWNEIPLANIYIALANLNHKQRYVPCTELVACAPQLLPMDGPKHVM